MIISDCDMMAVTDSTGQPGIASESSVVSRIDGELAANATIQSIVCRQRESVRLDARLSTVPPLFRLSANTAIPAVDPQGTVWGR
ncbi:MAG: hypothetical protein U0936_04435 [Planctomycetaceae bacterium]